MKYTIRIETNIPEGGVKDVDLFMSEISAKYGHKPENLLILVIFLTFDQNMIFLLQFNPGVAMSLGGSSKPCALISHSPGLQDTLNPIWPILMKHLGLTFDRLAFNSVGDKMIHN